MRANLLAVLVAALLNLAACASIPEPPATTELGPPGLNRDSASNIAWEALEPNTRSHDRANWTVVGVRRVSGQSVAEEFEAEVIYGYCGGPEPPLNGEIEPSETYWYVEMRPQPATPRGQSMSPTAPPLVPEPFVQRALFLIDERGEVIARMLACVVY